MKSWLLKNNHLLVIILVIIFFIKLPFIFHGRWDKDFFVPYMTDETCYSSPIYSFVTLGKFEFNSWYLSCAYPPFILNLLLPYFWALFKILLNFNVRLSSNSTYEIIYYNSRFFVLVLATIGSYFWVKLFDEQLKPKFYKIVLLLLVNLTALPFLYSTFIKTDEIVWALGAISLYCGLLFWKERTPSNYIKFFTTSVLPVLFGYNGYLYFLNFFLVSLFGVLTEHAFNKVLFLFLSLICAPIVWAIANFEIFATSGIYGLLSVMKEIKSGLASVPILMGANGYSSFQFYTDFLKENLVLPIVVLIAFVLFTLKAKSSYYRLISLVFALFFIHLTLSSYRTDRVLLPVYLFSIFLIVNLFYFVYEIAIKFRLGWLVTILTIVFFGQLLNKTVILAKTLTTKDTRQILYEYIEKNIPRRSEIFFVHFTTAGASSSSQKLLTSVKEFKIITIIIEDKEKAINQISNLKGYFVLPILDYDTLADFRETKYYSKQFKALEGLLSRSEKVAYFDKTNYSSKLFKRIKSSGSLYGIHNPPLAIYITKDAPAKETIYQVNEIPFEFIPRKVEKEISISLENLVFSTLDEEGKKLEPDLNKLKTTAHDGEKFLMSNYFKKPVELFYPYLGVNKKSIDLGYGFADKIYEGKEILFTTWVKADKPDCVSLGFYKGNINVIGWGESNLLGAADNKYELLSYDGKFDNPYSLNGHIRYRVNPGCSVELVLPHFFLLGEN